MSMQGGWVTTDTSMLSTEEKRILGLLEDLSSRSLSLADQAKPVEEINELLQRMEDEIDAKVLLGLPASTTFITLIRRRLVNAQKMCLSNYQLKQQQQVEQISEKPIISDNQQTPNQQLFGDRARSGDLQQSIYEAKTETMTQILHRMHDLAQEEVIKGEMNIDELDMSSKTLTELQNKYSAVDVLLNGSKRLVKLLEEADRWDRWCMLASLGFLAFAFAYVVYRRILHGPIKIVFWVLMKFLGVSRAVSSLAKYDSSEASNKEMLWSQMTSATGEPAEVQKHTDWDSAIASDPDTKIAYAVDTKESTEASVTTELISERKPSTQTEAVESSAQTAEPELSEDDLMELLEEDPILEVDPLMDMADPVESISETETRGTTDPTEVPERETQPEDEREPEKETGPEGGPSDYIQDLEADPIHEDL